MGRIGQRIREQRKSGFLPRKFRKKAVVITPYDLVRDMGEQEKEAETNEKKPRE